MPVEFNTAGRVQYNHLNDSELRPVPRRVFELLSKNHGLPVENHIDPAFDLEQREIQNYAASILSVMNWKSYAQYARDMKALLNS